MMKYVLTTLEVSDMDKSLEFYRDILEMPVIEEFRNKNGARIAMLGEASGAHLELICREREFMRPQESGISVGFETENVKALLEQIRRPYTGPVEPNPHMRFYFTTDPDGYRVQLIEKKIPDSLA